MEQWNNNDEKGKVDDIAEDFYEKAGWGKKGQLYSMNQYLLKHCLDFLLEEYDIKKSELKGNDIRKQINDIFQNVVGVEKRADEEIKNLKNKLFLILDSLLGKEKHKLLANDKGKYLFNNTNIVFLDYLLATFNYEDSKLIRKKMLLEVDEKYLEEIYFGLKELAKNENTLLKEEDVEKVWSVDYCMAYRKMMKARQSLNDWFDYYGGIPRDIESNVEFFGKVEELLYDCEKGVYLKRTEKV